MAVFEINVSVEAWAQQIALQQDEACSSVEPSK